MAFGFSVGDFIAVGNLIKDISSCLEDTGGAKAEYQELLRELECLQQVLQHLDKLQVGASSSSPTLDSIKYAALSCRRPLEQFLGKIRKYDKSLGVWGEKGVITGAAIKLRFGFGRKEEIRKLQNYLNIHIGTINILLAEHSLEKMDLASDKAAAHELHIRERLEGTRDIMKKISGSLATQFLAVESTQSMLSRLFAMVSGELRSSWRSLGDMVAKVLVSTQQTYAVILEIKSSLPGPDTRWSFFQAPLTVEDALGYKFPVPSEYDFGLLDAIIQQKFKTGPGSLEVQAGNYEYVKTKNSSDVLSRTSLLLPGTAITMAIIVAHPILTNETCPMPGCDSIQTTEALGGGRTCCKCNVWFSPTKKRRRPLHSLLSAISTLSDPSKTDYQIIETQRANKRARISSIEEDIGIFRNVRLSHDEIPDPPKVSDDASDNLETSGPRDHDSTPSGSSPDQFLLGTKELYSPLTIPGEEDGNESPQSITEPPVDIEQALSFLDKVKHRFLDQPNTYNQFLDILGTYQRDSTPVEDVYPQVVDLLDSAPDLVMDFNKFMPKSATYTQVPAAQATYGDANYAAIRKRRRSSLDSDHS